MIREKICLSCINIIFPPAAVYYVAGLGADVLINSLLFLCGVIPAHVHSFYLTWTYANRRRKVQAGRYPGPPRAMVFSERANNGGASNREVRALKERYERGEERPGFVRRVSSRVGEGLSRSRSRTATATASQTQEGRSVSRSRVAMDGESRRSRRMRRLEGKDGFYDEGYASMDVSPVSPVSSAFSGRSGTSSSRRSRARSKSAYGMGHEYRYDGQYPPMRDVSRRRTHGYDYGDEAQPVRSRAVY